MGSAREHLSQSGAQTGGVARDFKRLKSDGAATVAELRQFLGQMQGRSPQEVLGLVAKSGLTLSILLATFLFAVLLVALTVIPYALRDREAEAAGPAARQGAAAEQGATAEPEGSQPAPAPAGTAAASPGGETGTEGADPDRALDALGIGETRVAEPDENPLENKLDNLLDGIE